ncbi:hypothetical protein GPX89_13050 [Nocardia sp. ET3-3]|uniref:Uncharacterized protein n=1 Tax=Nocardia terrae TaxID=2675851 RepID=A0A7K1UVH5_9NOCA|nr:hypothetical protein [Nocardia terrae]MVU78169.1 hypothetical protein [Nocardia terrae]
MGILAAVSAMGVVGIGTAAADPAPHDAVLRTDPVWQAWGDVMDWHTGHCL